MHAFVCVCVCVCCSDLDGTVSFHHQQLGLGQLLLQAPDLQLQLLLLPAAALLLALPLRPHAVGHVLLRLPPRLLLPLPRLPRALGGGGSCSSDVSTVAADLVAAAAVGV